MRGAIAIDLVVSPDSFGDHLVEGVEEILSNLHIVVLINNDSRRCMGNKNTTYTLIDI